MKKYYAKNFIATLIAASFYLPAAFVNAISHSDRHAVEPVHDHGDNPIVTKVMFDQLELRKGDDENSLNIDAQVWIGNDLNKFWLKTDFEKHDGKIEDAEVQALYSRAIAPYWDLQIGLRQDQNLHQLTLGVYSVCKALHPTSSKWMLPYLWANPAKRHCAFQQNMNCYLRRNCFIVARTRCEFLRPK